MNTEFHELPAYAEQFSDLHRAAAFGDHETIRRCLACGDDIDGVSLCPHALGGEGVAHATPLYLAAGSVWGATEETVRLLLEAGANSRHESGHGSAAVAAVMGWYGCFAKGDATRLGVLLRAGCPLPEHEEAVGRVVGHAARGGNSECLRLLLEAGVSPNPLTDVEGSQARADEALKTMMAGFDFSDVLHEGALADELLEGLPDLIAEVVEKPKRGAGPPTFLCPLHSAALSGNVDCVQLLIDHGANPRAMNSDGKTAISLATTVKCVDALVAADPSLVDEGDVDELLEQLEDDDNPDLRDAIRHRIAIGAALQNDRHYRDDVLYHYAFTKNLPAVELLLELGVPVAKQGSTALHGLAWHYEGAADDEDVDFVEFTRTLIEAGISPNARDDAGNTPLHEAVAGDGANPTVIQELLRASTDPNLQNEEGQTPLVFLYETSFGYNNGELIRQLLDAGANPNLRDRRGQSAVDVARARAAGKEPAWREEQRTEEGLPCGWKSPADAGSAELASLRMIEEAAEQFSKTGDETD